jgi:hypothetical protein
MSSPIFTRSFTSIKSHPNIESFTFSNSSGADTTDVLPFIAACPNLKSLTCIGPRLFQLVNKIIVSCKRLASVHLSSDGHDDQGIFPMLLAIAEHGLQLKDLRIDVSKMNIRVRNENISNALVKIVKRFQCFEFKSRSFYNAADPDRSICSLFSSSDIDLRSLSVNSCSEDVDSVTAMLRGCHNAEQLNLEGCADISDVMIKVSNSCHQLVDLCLSFCGRVDGAAMRGLLQSCIY